MNRYVFFVHTVSLAAVYSYTIVCIRRHIATPKQERNQGCRVTLNMRCECCCTDTSGKLLDGTMQKNPHQDWRVCFFLLSIPAIFLFYVYPCISFSLCVFFLSFLCRQARQYNIGAEEMAEMFTAGM